MPRDAKVVRERLQQAALELFREHGYDQVKASDIAARAGVTERTFFRHFPDKREVFFDGEAELRAELTKAIEAVPADIEPLPALRIVFHELVPLIERNRPLTEPRAPVIAATPALHERELAKTAALVTLVAELLQARGTNEYQALLCARVGMDAFSTATRHWLTEPSIDLLAEVDKAFRELRAAVDTLGSKH